MALALRKSSDPHPSPLPTYRARGRQAVAPARGWRGFTLVELILVMAIMMLVAGGIAPSLRGFGAGRRGADAATLVLSLANYARTQAASEGRIYRLNFDPPARALWLTAEERGTFEPPTGDFGKHFDLPEGVEMAVQRKVELLDAKGGLYVEFHPTGRTEAAMIRLTDKLGGVIEVACESPTELYRVVPREEMSR